MAAQTCSDCGNRFMEDARFCRMCGKPRPMMTEAPQQQFSTSSYAVPMTQAPQQQLTSSYTMPMTQAPQQQFSTSSYNVMQAPQQHFAPTPPASLPPPASFHQQFISMPAPPAPINQHSMVQTMPGSVMVNMQSLAPVTHARPLIQRPVAMAAQPQLMASGPYMGTPMPMPGPMMPGMGPGMVMGQPGQPAGPHDPQHELDPAYFEQITEVPKLHVQVNEKLVEVPEPQIVDRIIQVPQIQEVVTEVPGEVHTRLTTREVPKIVVQQTERVVEVPDIEYIDREVEVPVVHEILRRIPRITVHEIPIERIIQVPKKVIQEIEQPVYRPVPHLVRAPVDRQIPVPKPVIQSYDEVTQVGDVSAIQRQQEDRRMAQHDASQAASQQQALSAAFEAGRASVQPEVRIVEKPYEVRVTEQGPPVPYVPVIPMNVAMSPPPTAGPPAPVTMSQTVTRQIMTPPIAPPSVQYVSAPPQMMTVGYGTATQVQTPVAQSQSLFDAIDRNGDGVITREELNASNVSMGPAVGTPPMTQTVTRQIMTPPSAPPRSVHFAAPPVSSPMVCECGNHFMDDARFCRRCGKPRPAQATAYSTSMGPAYSTSMGNATPPLAPMQPGSFTMGSTMPGSMPAMSSSVIPQYGNFMPPASGAFPAASGGFGPPTPPVPFQSSQMLASPYQSGLQLPPSSRM